MRRALAVLAAVGLAVTGTAATAAPAGPPAWCHPDYAIRSGGGWLCVGPAPTEPAPELARIAGGNRYDTSAAISATFWQPGEATTVYLANGQGMADAIAGGASVDGPVLLVPSGEQVPASVLAEIQRLAPVQVVALGGPNAVTDTQLAAATAAGQ